MTLHLRKRSTQLRKLHCPDRTADSLAFEWRGLGCGHLRLHVSIGLLQLADLLDRLFGQNRKIAVQQALGTGRIPRMTAPAQRWNSACLCFSWV